MNYLIFSILLVSLLLITGCVNNYGISGTYIDVKNNNTCLDFSSDGTYLIRSISSSIAVQDRYQVKNNQILLSIPLNSMLGGGGANNIVLTCDVIGDRLNCGKLGGVFQKTASCNSFVTRETTPTPIPTPQSSIVTTGEGTDTMTFTGTYQDKSGLTTNVKFVLTDWDTQTPICSKELGNPGTSRITASCQTPNVRGKEVTAKFVYVRDLP